MKDSSRSRLGRNNARSHFSQNLTKLYKLNFKSIIVKKTREKILFILKQCISREEGILIEKRLKRVPFFVILNKTPLRGISLMDEIALR